MGRGRLSEVCQRVSYRFSTQRGFGGAVGPSVVLWVGVSQDRFSSSACSILMMCGADGISFVESLPRQFVVGKNWPGGRGSRGPPYGMDCLTCLVA